MCDFELVHKIAFDSLFFKLDKHFCFFKKSPVTSAAIATPGYYFSCKSILHFCSAAVSKTKLVIVLVLT